jgi:hypothetical protein
LDVYAKTRGFSPIAVECRELGFEVLLGPPHESPPIAFIGYQPSQGKLTAEQARAEEYEDHWPPVCEYATKNWPLACVMKKMFGEQLLEKCVGLNAIFVRVRSIPSYTKEVPASTRALIETFCLDQVKRMVNAIDPMRVIIIGFATAQLFDKQWRPRLVSPNGRILMREGSVFGRDAIATLHLTGSWISTADRESIAKACLAF